MVAGQWSGRDTAYANQAAIVCNDAIICMQHNILTIYRQNGDILHKMNDLHKHKCKDVFLFYKWRLGFAFVHLKRAKNSQNESQNHDKTNILAFISLCSA